MPKPSARSSYGPGEDQFAERFGHGERVAALLHGGFWRAKYDCTLEHGVAEDLADRGFTAWNVEYRRGQGWEAMALDVFTALETIRPDVVIGHSAGGHLALWAAANGLTPAVVSQAGVNDLAACDRLGLSNGAVRELFAGPPPPDADPWLLRPIPARVLCVHGARDEDVPVTMSTAWEDEADVVVIEEEGHYEHLDPQSRVWQAVTAWLSA